MTRQGRIPGEACGVDYLWAGLLVIASLGCWAVNLFSLPFGNWLMAGLAALYAWLGPGEGRLDLDWGIVAVLGVLAGAGELVEFLAGAMGARRVGGSRRAALLAMLGSVAGGLLGMVVALPIPVVGPLLGAILFASAGALGGAPVGGEPAGRKGGLLGAPPWNGRQGPRLIHHGLRRGGWARGVSCDPAEGFRPVAKSLCRDRFGWAMSQAWR